MVEVSTSVLSVNEEESIKVFYNLETAKTDYFHIDVMDGKFVKNDTREKMMRFTEQIKSISNLPLDIHLMVNDVKENVLEYISLKPNIITFHIEAMKNKNEIMDVIKLIKEHNIRVGISVKPNTDISEIEEYLPYVHLVLVMTVEPGKGGQQIIKDTVKKVEYLNKKYIEPQVLDFDIEVDGGINLDTANLVKEAGASILVSGSAIISEKDYLKVIKELKK